MKLSKNHRLGIAAIAAFSLLAGAAQATHWPMAGGDAGRSGHQVADQAALPMKFRWRVADDVRTSPIVTSGANLDTQRAVWGHMGTNPDNPADTDALIRLVKFSDKSAVADVDIDDEPGDDADAFGPSPTYDVAPVEAASHSGGPAQIYVVHNDDNQPTFREVPGTDPDYNEPPLAGNDLGLAQIDGTSGTLVADQMIGSNNPLSGFNTNGYTVESAPVITPDTENAGEYDLIFLARSATEKRIIKLNIPSAASTGAHTFTVEASANIADLNTRARPTVMVLQEPSDASYRTMVAVGTTDGVKTFRLGLLTDAGPSISGLGLTWTPSVPVALNGNPPPRTPFFYVASASAGGTVVRKLKQNSGAGGDPTLSELIVAENDGTSPELPGVPSHGVAVAQSTGTTIGAVPTPGRVIVTTSANLYSLNTENLSEATPPALFNSDAASGQGFGRTIAATSGELGFAVTDAGQQYVFYLTPRGSTGMRVMTDETGFVVAESALAATASRGQTAVSRGRAVFPSNNGAYTYGASVTITKPGPNATVKATDPTSQTLEAYVFDPNLTSVQFKIDGSPVGGAQPVTDKLASTSFNSLNYSEGIHNVVAEASGDGEETESSAPRAFIIDNFKNPNATLTVNPNPGNVGQNVTLNASGSTISSGETETIDQWAFEIDGDNDYNDIVENRTSGGDGIVTHQFTTPGSKTLSVRVTDSHGDSAIATVNNYRVNAPPTFDLRATPNPATSGQPVEIDATATDSDGTIAEYAFDLDGDGAFELRNGTNPKTSKAFTATTKVSARVTDNEGGQAVQSVTVTVPAANQPPVASFIVAPNPARTGQDVGFSAAASKDPEGGPITKYEWDFDGNGTFEVNNGTNPILAHRFAQAGVFKVGLRVTDNAGLTGTSSVDVIVSAARCVVGNRCTPRISASVSPKRDRALPYRFRTRGRVRLPSGVRAADGCRGRVSVQVKAGKRTISNRRVRLRSTCRFTSKVTFRDRKRMGNAKSLRFNVRFLGNKLLKPRRASVKTVRIG